jgi:two-component system sensor histidine kinase SenX3
LGHDAASGWNLHEILTNSRRETAKIGAHMARRLPKGPDSSWWWIFGLLIGVPALVLAALGISALRLDEVEQRQRVRDRQDQIARLADAALAAALERESTNAREGPPDASGSVRFETGDGQAILFPGYRTYVAPLAAASPAEAAVTISPKALLLSERAQQAAAQGNLSTARTLYQQLRDAGELRAWAALQLDLLESSSIPAIELASSAEKSPSGIPLAIVAIGAVDVESPRAVRAVTPFLEATLLSLREGRWWLSLEQRRSYDAMLRELLTSGGVATSEDPRLALMESLAHLVRTTFEANRHVPARAEIAGAEGSEVLLVWSRPATSSPTARWSGIAVQRKRIEALTAAVLEPLTKGQGFAAALGDQRRAAWPSPLGDTARALPLESLTGWSIAFSDGAESATLQRRLLHYSTVILPVVMLAVGLAMTAWIIRRELALRAMQSTFIAAVTHEFKSPITSIRLLIERITGGRGADPAAVERYSAAMAAEADRLETLVNRLLDVQKSQAGQKQYIFQPTALGHLVHDVVERVRPHAESRRIALALDAPGELAPTPVDADAIADAVRNLLDNAIKYSDPGGSVDVSIAAHNAHVLVNVADNGVGVDPREASRIFEPFYRSVRGDRTNVQGTGLGLAQVKAIADAHGGSITVTANGARGSRFTLALPSRRPDLPETA